MSELLCTFIYGSLFFLYINIFFYFNFFVSIESKWINLSVILYVHYETSEKYRFPLGYHKEKHGR